MRLSFTVCCVGTWPAPAQPDAGVTPKPCRRVLDVFVSTCCHRPTCYDDNQAAHSVSTTFPAPCI